MDDETDNTSLMLIIDFETISQDDINRAASSRAWHWIYFLLKPQEDSVYPSPSITFPGHILVEGVPNVKLIYAPIGCDPYTFLGGYLVSQAEHLDFQAIFLSKASSELLKPLENVFQLYIEVIKSVSKLKEAFRSTSTETAYSERKSTSRPEDIYSDDEDEEEDEEEEEEEEEDDPPQTSSDEERDVSTKSSKMKDKDMKKTIQTFIRSPMGRQLIGSFLKG